MAALPISAHSAHFTYPLTQKEARHSARLWFTGTPHLTLAEWRDNRCRVHCMGLPADPARIEAFNTAFSAELAAIIAGGFTNREADGQPARPGVPAPIERAISAFGYANRHPEDAQGIERAYKALVASIIAGGSSHK